MIRFPAAALAAALLVAGCDASGSTDVETQPVVSAFLEADAPLARVTLSRTVPLGAFYDPDAAVIADATVEVQLLAADGRIEQTFPYVYTERLDGPGGSYIPRPTPGDLPEALPGRTYRLVAQALGREVTAETTVPARFEIVEAPPAEVGYRVIPNGPPVRITTSSVAGRQSVYVVTTRALAPDLFDPFERDGETFYRSRNEPGRFRPVPFIRLELVADCVDVGAFLECGRDPNDIFTSGTSPIINESSYRLQGDGTAIVDLPWIAFGFYGPSAVSLVALDDAFQDLLETQATQGGGTTLSPGEIPNITSNVRGGLGTFGSFASESVQVTIVEQPFRASR